VARGVQAAGLRATIEPRLIAELLLLGTATGFLAGLLGIGGGMIQVPFLSWVLAQRGVPHEHGLKMAIATAMATIVFTSLSSVRAHHARGAVRWEIVRAMAPGLVIGGLVAGAGVFALIKGAALGLVFALFVGYSATQMLIDRKPRASRQMPGAAGQAAAGAGIGALASLVGAGGAFMSVPFMVWCNVPIQQAVGTSAALGFPVALAATLGYVIGGWALAPALPGTIGFLYLPALFVVALASVFAAPWGARVAHSMDTRWFRRVFAILLYGVAGAMAWRAFG
jgi:uncharacterized membrane protein YfcA